MDELTEWVKSAQGGDADSYGKVVLRLQDMAYACAAAYLGDPHLAQDAAQEAFVAAYLELQAGKLNAPANFPGWLKTIVRHQCSRMTRRHRLPVEPLESAAGLAAPAEAMEDGMDRAAQQRVAMLALQALPEGYRLVTVLYYFSGYSTEQIADFLGVPLTTVKKRLHDARHKLQQWVVHAMSQNLQEHSPSRDPRFAAKIRHMIQPEALKKAEPLLWSPGIGTDVWELFCAAVSGDLEAIKRLLSKDAALVRCQHAYRTPLYFSVRENQLEVTAFLLDRDADPLRLAVNDSLLDIARDRGYSEMAKLLEANRARAHGASPKGEGLAAAIRARDLTKVRALLDASPEFLHAADARGNQPIHWAVMTRQPEMIDELLARGADINAKRFDGARPLQLTNGDYHFRGWRDVPKDHPVTHEAVFTHLLSRGAYFDICSACHKGNLDRVRDLLDQDPTLVNRPSDYVTYYAASGTPLRNAATGGHLEIVKLLLERGADPNLAEEGIAPKGHALYSAVVGGHYEIAKLLLEKGAYPNAPVESSGDCLSRATSRKDEKMIELLASYGAAQSMDIMAYYGDVRTAAAVFAVDPTQADDPEALACAAGEGQEAFVRLMLRYQPELPKRVDFPSWSVGAKTRELNELLFKHGMNASQRDWLGVTPLHEFARKGNLEKAAIFIEHGADLHARDEDICSTPLGWAAKFGKLEMAEFLLQRGAKPNLPDDPPWATPLAWATQRGHHQIAEVLKQHGAH